MAVICIANLDIVTKVYFGSVSNRDLESFPYGHQSVDGTIQRVDKCMRSKEGSINKSWCLTSKT